MWKKIVDFWQMVQDGMINGKLRIRLNLVGVFVYDLCFIDKKEDM